MLVTSPFIVLEKSPCREAGLQLRGLSPDNGRITLMLYGGQALSEKKFPEADLFREIEVEFDDDNSGKDRFNAKKAELTTDFSAIADDPRAYKMAGRIGAFLLNNAPAAVPQPYTYDTLRSVFANLAKTAGEHAPWDLMQCSVVLKTAYLYENGLLPEAANETQNEFLENLVASGIDNAELPPCREEYWSSLNNWLNSLIAYHQLKH